MTIAPQLERELIEAVRRHGEASSGKPHNRLSRLRRWRSRPLLAATVAAGLLALAGGAFAASVLLERGAPLRLPDGAHLNPHGGYGVPRPGGVQMLDISTPDPAGGPPWGARLIATTRGVGCLQIGRLVRGRLGVIGKDGAFGDDGRFHPLASDYLEGPFPCATLDGDGHAFASVAIDGLPASGFSSGDGDGGCLAPEAPAGAAARQGLPVCPAVDERLVMAGMAGPLAKQVTYREEGRLRSVPTAGPDGAYLIVTRMPSSVRDDGDFLPLIEYLGGGTIVQIAYRDGTVSHCRPTGPVHERLCKPLGEARRSTTPITAAAVKAPVLLASHRGTRERTLEVSFKARAVARSASSQYWISLRVPGPSGKCGYETLGPVSHDVEKGQTVHKRFRVSDSCHGRFEATVTYRQSTRSEAPVFAGGERHTRALLVGKDATTIRR